MKYTKVFVVLFLAVSLISCNNDNICYNQDIEDNKVAVNAVKSELFDLNASYKPVKSKHKKTPKWLRWLIFGAADVAGGIWGGVAGACSASSLAWTVTKGEEKKADYNSQSKYSQMEPTFKENNLQGIETGSVGYIHNTVISSAFIANDDICEMDNEEVLSVVFQTLENETSTSLSDTEKAEIINYTYTIVNSFDINKSVEEYFNDLKMQTSDQKKKDALEICSIVLDGLQCVDDNDTTYVKAATDIIKNSNVSQELKTTLLNGVSVAHASAKLWNTDRIGTIHK